MSPFIAIGLIVVSVATGGKVGVLPSAPQQATVPSQAAQPCSICALGSRT